MRTITCFSIYSGPIFRILPFQNLSKGWPIPSPISPISKPIFLQHTFASRSILAIHAWGDVQTLEFLPHISSHHDRNLSLHLLRDIALPIEPLCDFLFANGIAYALCGLDLVGSSLVALIDVGGMLFWQPLQFQGKP